MRNVSCQDIVEEITAGYIREKIWSASEDLLLHFQATSSGPLLRKEYEARKSFLYEQEDHVVKLQVCDSPTTTCSEQSCPLRNVLFDNRTVNYQHSNKQIWLQIFSLIHPQVLFIKATRWEGYWMIFHLWPSRKYSGAPWIPQVPCQQSRQSQRNFRSDLKSCFSKKLDLLMSPTLWLGFLWTVFVLFLDVSGCQVVSERTEELMK